MTLHILNIHEREAMQKMRDARNLGIEKSEEKTLNQEEKQNLESFFLKKRFHVH